MVIVNAITYRKIIEFLRNYNGLSIECDDFLAEKFPEIPINTLKSINSKYGQNAMRTFYSKYHNKAHLILDE